MKQEDKLPLIGAMEKEIRGLLVNYSPQYTSKQGTAYKSNLVFQAKAKTRLRASEV